MSAAQELSTWKSWAMTAKARVLRETFGFDSFRPGQEEIVDSLVDGRHVLAVMPTGSGKSLCYQVPALVKGGLAIVVSPLVALMQDQVAALKLAGVAAETINSAGTRDIVKKLFGGKAEVFVSGFDRPNIRLTVETMHTSKKQLAALLEGHGGESGNSEDQLCCHCFKRI